MQKGVQVVLQLILGRAGSGKTHYIREQAGRLAQQNAEKIMLLVPEQYSFETEKAMLALLGPQQVQNIEIMSFSRLTDAAFRAFGSSGIPELQDGERNIFMHLAIEQVKNELEFYSVCGKEMIPMLLSISTELKMCALTPKSLLETAHKTSDEKLRQKLREVGLILSAYDALVAQSYLDPLDDLQRLAETFAQRRFFAGYHIYIDSFKGFTRQEFDLIALMMVQAEQVSISLTCDTLDDAVGAEVFARVRHTANLLLRLARQNGVKTAVPVALKPGARFANEALRQVEAQVFSSAKQPQTGVPEQVAVYCAETVYGEAAFVGATIRRLVMEQGYRYSDFAIIARDLEDYRSILDTALEQYEVPYFMDTARCVYAEPLMCFVLYALEILKSGFSSDAVFVYLKTGLAGLTSYEISLLENYTFLWNISGKKWTQEWCGNADGFTDEQTERQVERLAQINVLRNRVIQPLLQLQRRVQNGTGVDFAKALYQFLEAVEAESSLRKLQEKLEQMGQSAAAAQQVQLWNILMDILDQCANGLEKEILTVPRFAELLRLMMLSYDVAGIPQSLDHVMIGTAERMRPAQPKVMFVIGAVQGRFPAAPQFGGIFSCLERQALLDLGLELSGTAEEKAIEEQYLAYAAMTGASQRLYVTFYAKELSGASKMPSEMVQELLKVFPELTVQTEERIGKVYFACTQEAAFFTVAGQYRSNTPLQATLKAALAERNGCKSRLQALENACEKPVYRFVEPAYAKELFGRRTAVSATQIEQYHLCPFQYFCRYGLGLKERRVAQFDPMEYGSLIHDLLQYMFEQFKAQEILEMEQSCLHSVVLNRIALYVSAKMGGQEKTPRFEATVARVAEAACAVVLHIARELAQSRFVPIGCELELKAGNHDFPPLCVPVEGDDSVLVEGKIDRVDVMEQNGVRYLRVVDYKTGSKEFQIGDIVNGVNLQMLIYLAALMQTGQYRPAGVLYMPAVRRAFSGQRDMTDEQARCEQDKKMRMNGVVAEDTVVIQGMEAQAQGVYIPVALKDGVPKSHGSLLGYDEIELVLRYMKRLVADMAVSLRQGHVEALPLTGDYDGCAYCPYFTVCRHEKEDSGNQRVCRKKDEVLEQLKQEEAT